MDLGIALPHVGPHASREAIVRVAQEAERLDYGAVWVLERLLRPTFPIPQPRGGSGLMPEAYAVVYEPIETLVYVAAKTERIRLGTSVIDALFHAPVVLAKRFAALDQFSGGRAIAGLGQGATAPEFETANVPMKRRGAGFEEFIRALKAAWGPDPVKFEGRFYKIPESQINPKPVQPGGPPIWGGGTAPAALERAARYFDGWFPNGPDSSMFEGVGTGGLAQGDCRSPLGPAPASSPPPMPWSPLEASWVGTGGDAQGDCRRPLSLLPM